MRRLIVNADDCNLTAGVTRAILECHERGIVSSTTWISNLPANQEMVKLVIRSGLGVGVHLNVTLGKPLSKLADVGSLINSDGSFKKKSDYLKSPPEAQDLAHEYFQQILMFEKIFGKAPTHLDTHHQMHDEPDFMRVLAQVAREKKLPIRTSALMQKVDFQKRYPGLVTTQMLCGDLDAHAFWTEEKFDKTVSELPAGVTEIMCHPGVLDDELRKITSMTVTREKEYRFFSTPSLKKVLERHKICLIHFGQLTED